MKTKQKILVIRFNAIGDIILTSPVLKTLFNEGHEVHFATKKAFETILKNCPYVSKIWCLEDSFNSFVTMLQEQKFDLVVDLHNNFRSKRLKLALGKKSYTLKKDRIMMWMMINLGIWRKPKKHIVNRFLDTIKDFTNNIEKTKVEFFQDTGVELNSKFTIPEKYHVIAVGAAYYTKQIPNELIVQIIENAPDSIILIGGKQDRDNSELIVGLSTKKVLNLCGLLSIHESAKIINDSMSVVSGDTGMMHLTNALEKRLIAVFGSTHPILGYFPFNQGIESKSYIIQNDQLNCRPCTKQGRDFCPKGHFKCMKELDYRSIVDKMR